MIAGGERPRAYRPRAARLADRSSYQGFHATMVSTSRDIRKGEKAEPGSLSTRPRLPPFCDLRHLTNVAFAFPPVVPYNVATDSPTAMLREALHLKVEDCLKTISKPCHSRRWARQDADAGHERPGERQNV